MGKTLIAVFLLLAAAPAFAQAPLPARHTASSDLFAGVAVNVPDYSGAGVDFVHGYELGYTLHVSAHWGLTVSGGQFFSNRLNVHQWQLTAGPRFNFLTGRFRPYATAQFGASNQDSDVLHPGILDSPAKLHDAATARLGGGADYQLTPRFYWRIGQWAAQPILHGRHTSSLFQNFSTGVGFEF